MNTIASGSRGLEDINMPFVGRIRWRIGRQLHKGAVVIDLTRPIGFNLQHQFQGTNGPVGPGAVGLVDHQQIGNLQNARLDRLHFIAQARRFNPA